MTELADLSRAAQRIRNALNGPTFIDAPDLFEALDLLEAAALMPRTASEATIRMLTAQEESDDAYKALRDWTEWADKLTPEPPPLTRWGAHAQRDHIESALAGLRATNAALVAQKQCTQCLGPIVHCPECRQPPSFHKMDCSQRR